jgi:hypothetical protein
MAVIEVAKPGFEATTYELIITAGNAALNLNGIISTQLLYPMGAVGCEDDSGDCPSSTVDVTDEGGFNASNGPARFTNYCLLLTGISLVACFIFTPFMPASKEQCHEWREQGELAGQSVRRGYITLAVCITAVLVRFSSLC